MEQLLALEMVRVTEAAAIASARFMGRGDAPRGGPRGDRGDAPDDGRDGHRRHDRHRRGRAGRGADAVHRRAGRPPRRRRARRARSTSRSIRSRARTSWRPGQGDAITVLAASEKGGLTHAPDTYLEKLVRRTGRGRLRRHHAAAGREHAPDRRGAPPQALGHHGDHPRPAAARGADRRGPVDRRPDQADHRRRPVGRHRVRGPGHRRPRGDGHRRGARGRDHRGGAALPGRRDPGAVPVPQRRGARAGQGRCSATPTRTASTGPRTSRRATSSCSRRPASPSGELLQGVRFFGGGARTHSLVMAYQTKQVRFVDTVHMFDRDRPPAVRL